MQDRFLGSLLITKEDAFCFHNFAPATLRRDIGILGFLHKRTLGECHPAIKAFLPMDPPGSNWHDKQISPQDSSGIRRRHLFQRSVFGMIDVYNRLPPCIIECTTVKDFQKQLTSIARSKCNNGDASWPQSFRSCSQLWQTRIALNWH